MPDYAGLKRRIVQLAIDDHRHAARSRRPFDPVLSESQVDAFEKLNAISLPEDYRAYIITVANGGPGPGVGPLLPLDGTTDHKGKLQKPFLFSELWCPNCSQDCSNVEDLMVRLSVNDLDDLTQGSLYLGHDGCSLGIHLVITGPMRGQIWIQDFRSGNGIWPEGDYCLCMRCDEYPWNMPPRRFSFYEWFDQWIKDEYRELESESDESP